MDDEELFVDYKDFDISKIKFENIEERTASHSSNKYKVIPIQYNYGPSEDLHLTSNLYLQLPPCKLKYIRKYNSEQQTDRKFVANLYFNISEESSNCIENINTIYKKCCNFLYKDRHEVGISYFNAEIPEPIFKNPIQYERNKLTADILQYKKPWMIIKVIPDGNEQSQFLYQDMNDIDLTTGLPNLKEIKWSCLMGSSLTVIPLIKFESINVNHKIVIRCVLTSAIVLDYTDKNIKKYRQMSTAANIYKYNPKIATKITSTISKVYKNYEDSVPDPVAYSSVSEQSQQYIHPNVPQQSQQSSKFVNYMSSRMNTYPNEPQLTTFDDFISNKMDIPISERKFMLKLN